jgi:predicted nucleotidyltransferase
MTDVTLIKKKIVDALIGLNPEKIILFGSYAYGNPTEDSDLDICVIEKDYKDKWEEKFKIRECLKEINIPKDILLEKEDFFNKHTTEDWVNTAWYDALHYGELLYEKK